MNQNKKLIKVLLHYTRFKQQLSFENINLKVDQHTGDKWFIHTKNQLLTLEHCF